MVVCCAVLCCIVFRAIVQTCTLPELNAMYAITSDLSPRAAYRVREAVDAELTPLDNLSPVAKYPFAAMPHGTNFLVPFGDTTERRLRTACGSACRYHAPRKFTVVKHAEYALYEVVRIA